MLSTLGWTGMLLVVGAFACANLAWIERGTTYFALNAVGSLLLCASNVARRNFQSLSLNGIWAAIAVVAIFEALIA